MAKFEIQNKGCNTTKFGNFDIHFFIICQVTQIWKKQCHTDFSCLQFLKWSNLSIITQTNFCFREIGIPLRIFGCLSHNILHGEEGTFSTLQQNLPGNTEIVKALQKKPKGVSKWNKRCAIPPLLKVTSVGLAMSCRTLTIMWRRFCSRTTFSAKILLLNNCTLTCTTRFDNWSTLLELLFSTSTLAIFW